MRETPRWKAQQWIAKDKVVITLNKNQKIFTTCAFSIILLLVSLGATHSNLASSQESHMTEQNRHKVTGIGGVFFKAPDSKETLEWYRKHLGIYVKHWEGEGESPIFQWHPLGDPDRTAYTVWAPFKAETKYFDPGGADFMINYRVDDLDGILEQLQDEGVEVVDGPMSHFNGRFAWIRDIDGRKVELWEPAPGH